MNKFANILRALKGTAAAAHGADDGLQALIALISKRRGTWEAAQAAKARRAFGLRGAAPAPIIPGGGGGASTRGAGSTKVDGAFRGEPIGDGFMPLGGKTYTRSRVKGASDQAAFLAVCRRYLSRR